MISTLNSVTLNLPQIQQITMKLTIIYIVLVKDIKIMKKAIGVESFGIKILILILGLTKIGTEE